MSAKKDMRRPDLIIPYQEPAPKESASDIAGTLASTLPMAAMFTRNKFISWAAVVLAIQNWLGESQDTKKTTSQPAYFSVGMSCMYSCTSKGNGKRKKEKNKANAVLVMSLAVTYLPLFMPPPGGVKTATGTEAPAPASL
ncbi:hypothetical protein GLAREA_12007 [Glarea lozoyensis ATCC 20868]|uniref:Uncharacterized protein n=1 Tax=Glarea lozoyensis (strain ATCC 20868 / MF5171) TaxID=1116229 RepID=S3D281_GLAL2|nr:uncharacterized protein GLAREA_12007 [Glarea lozoyensis ATCC 20868]EPE31925.1 hypothetical protein GLAREA_12007 [Glarea lozoyensis ATCC 20868]